MEGRIAFGDRLTAEVLQIVREGLSNICRHTVAQRGAVRLRCGDGMLRIEINNDNGGRQPLPSCRARSASAPPRWAARPYVRQGAVDHTGVCVEIPV